MTTNNSVLKFAHFSLPLEAGSLPLELQIDDSVMQLLNRPIKSYSFRKEYELIARYNDLFEQQLIKQQEKELLENMNKAINDPDANKSIPQNQNVDKELEEAIALSMNTANMNHQTSSVSMNPTIVNSSANVNPRDKMIMQMMEQTGEERDVCFFYLESSAWDLAQAIQLMKSMSSM